MVNNPEDTPLPKSPTKMEPEKNTIETTTKKEKTLKQSMANEDKSMSEQKENEG